MKYNKNFTLCSHNSDFEPRIRDAVIDYMVQRFGSEYVSAIGTFGVTRTKVAIQDVGRVFGIPAQETLTITKQLKDADDDAPLDQLEEEFPVLKKYLDKWESQGYNLRYYINGIRNAHRNISQHAAGVLVSSDKLIDNVALVQSRKRVVTGWQEGSDYHELSDLGYYKYDILGLNNLQVVNDAHTLIKKRRGVEIDWDSLDLDEEFVYKNVVHNHDHYGTFQFESNLARKLMKDIEPDNFDELSAVSSLLRPGPLRMGMHTEFADRKHGRKIEGQDYDIPECIRDIVGPTYGIMCLSGEAVVTTDQGLLEIKDIVNNRLNVNVLSENEKGEHEWKPIVNWFDNGIRELIEIEFESGQILRCTPDHEIYTKNRGKVEAQYLSEEDEIVIL